MNRCHPLSTASATAKNRTSLSRLLLLAVGALFLAGCGGAPARDDDRLRVVTTTTMITDMVRAIGGERIMVEGLMGPGVDPHLYKATSSDITRLKRADLIFYNGLMLEGRMEELFRKMATPVYALTDAVPRELLLRPEEFEGEYDPHIWFDASLWEHGVDLVMSALSEADPDGVELYQQRGSEYRRTLRDLHRWVVEKVAELPEQRRILVTSHDAYNYFGRAYGFEVVGLQGISTATEAGLADMAKLVDFIKSREVGAVFVESSVSPAAIQRISRDAGVKIGGELFSDAMGAPGEMIDGFDVGTFEGMMKYNVQTIVEALK